MLPLQVKLIDVEDLGYKASNDEGEVCFRGAALMSGYFNDPKLTAKTVDEEVSSFVFILLETVVSKS